MNIVQVNEQVIDDTPNIKINFKCNNCQSQHKINAKLNKISFCCSLVFVDKSSFQQQCTLSLRGHQEET